MKEIRWDNRWSSKVFPGKILNASLEEFLENLWRNSRSIVKRISGEIQKELLEKPWSKSRRNTEQIFGAMPGVTKSRSKNSRQGSGGIPCGDPKSLSGSCWIKSRDIPGDTSKKIWTNFDAIPSWTSKELMDELRRIFSGRNGGTMKEIRRNQRQKFSKDSWWNF